MPDEAPSPPDNKEQSRRSLEKAREIGAAREDPAAENLKRQGVKAVAAAARKWLVEHSNQTKGLGFGCDTAGTLMQEQNLASRRS